MHKNINNTKTIVLAAGGTGGHLFSAIALAESLSKARCDIHLITDTRCEKYLAQDQDIPVILHIHNLHIKIFGLSNKLNSIYQLITTFFKETLPTGQHDFALPNLPSGIYFLKIEDSLNRAISRRLIFHKN